MGTTSELGLLLLHALPLDGRMWRNQLEILPGRTVVPDLYEFGDEITQWAARCLDLVPQDKFVVAGCSVGGSCALEVINLAPDRVAAAVLIGTKARCDPNQASHDEACRTLKEQGVEGSWERFWNPLFERDEVGSVAPVAKEIALQQSVIGLENGLNAFYTRNSREDVVMESKVPIHVVTGDRDRLPGVQYSRQLSELSEKARLHVIDDCGHYVPMAQAGGLNRLITDVISGAEHSA